MRLLNSKDLLTFSFAAAVVFAFSPKESRGSRLCFLAALLPMLFRNENPERNNLFTFMFGLRICIDATSSSDSSSLLSILKK